MTWIDLVLFLCVLVTAIEYGARWAWRGGRA